jgi:hypothetical protein
MGMSVTALPIVTSLRIWCNRSAAPSTDDHKVIDVIVTRIEEAGRSRSAFGTLVYRKAQLILDDARVWLAVEALAESLCDFWPPSDDLAFVGTLTGCMGGAEARAIMRQ